MDDLTRQLERQWLSSQSELDHNRYMQELERLGRARSLHCPTPIKVHALRFHHQQPPKNSLQFAAPGLAPEIYRLETLGRTPRFRNHPIRASNDQLIVAEPLSPAHYSLDWPTHAYDQVNELLGDGKIDGLVLNFSNVIVQFEPIKWPHVKALILLNYPEDADLPLPFERCSALEYLIFENTEAATIRPFRLNTLKKLKAFVCSYEVDQPVLGDLKQNKGLEVLGLGPINAPTPIDFRAWPLKSLDLLDPKGLNAALLPHSLRDLRLAGLGWPLADHWGPEDNAALAQLPALETLCMPHIQGLDLEPLANRGTLKQLIFDNHDQAPLGWLKGQSQLQCLSLISQHELPEKAFEPLDQLEELALHSLKSLSSISDQSLPKLKRLSLRKCQLLPSFDFSQLPKLEELALFSCGGLTTAHFQQLSRCQTLTSLSLKESSLSAENWTEAALLLKDCGGLRSLNLGDRIWPPRVFTTLTRALPHCQIEGSPAIPRRFRILFSQARDHLEIEPLESLTLCQQVLDREPEFTEAQLVQVEALTALERFQEASETLNRAYETSPSAENAFLKAQYHWRLGEQAQALKAITRAISERGLRQEFLCFRQDLLTELGRFEDSLKDLRRLIESYQRGLGGDHVWTHDAGPLFSNSAYLNLLLENYEAALDDTDIGLGLDPDDSSARRTRAEALAKLERHEQAVDEYSRLIADDADDFEALRERARSYLELGDTNKARVDFLCCQELAPHHPSLESLRALFPEGQEGLDGLSCECHD